MTTKTTYKNMITTTLLIIATLLIQSCNKPTEPAKESISVTVEDVSCTEAWLRISDNNYSGNVTVVVKRDDTDALTINLNNADTIVVDDGLLPNKAYTFKAVKMMGSNVIEASKPVTAVTLDTTSHNFTWQTFEFGQHSSSVLYDVAIIDENNIWAVGEIYMKDSLGNYDHNAYNAVHWDGSEWNLKRIYFPTVCGSTSVTAYPAKAIFAFDDGQIWISSSGDKIARLQNGVQLDKYCLPPNVSMSINKLWGSSPNDLYAVGNGGNIAHWNGSSWKKIESGTNLNIVGIWGDFNPKSLETEIICIAGESIPGIQFKMFKLNKNGTSNIKTDGIEQLASTCWFIAGKKYYVAGEGIKYTYMLNTPWKSEKNVNPDDFGRRIKGQTLIDIFTAGIYGLISHYNGYSWKHYTGSEVPYFQGWYGSVDTKGNTIVTVGHIQYSIVDIKGIITIGKRN